MEIDHRKPLAQRRPELPLLRLPTEPNINARPYMQESMIHGPAPGDASHGKTTHDNASNGHAKFTALTDTRNLQYQDIPWLLLKPHAVRQSILALLDRPLQKRAALHEDGGRANRDRIPWSVTVAQTDAKRRLAPSDRIAIRDWEDEGGQ